MVENELPIQRLMASGSCWRARRAKGGEGETCEKRVELVVLGHILPRI